MTGLPGMRGERGAQGAAGARVSLWSYKIMFVTSRRCFVALVTEPSGKLVSVFGREKFNEETHAHHTAIMHIAVASAMSYVTRLHLNFTSTVMTSL